MAIFYIAEIPFGHVRKTKYENFMFQSKSTETRFSALYKLKRKHKSQPFCFLHLPIAEAFHGPSFTITSKIEGLWMHFCIIDRSKVDISTPSPPHKIKFESSEFVSMQFSWKSSLLVTELFHVAITTAIQNSKKKLFNKNLKISECFFFSP